MVKGPERRRSGPHPMDMNLGKVWERVEDKRAWGTAVHGAAADLALDPALSLTSSSPLREWLLLEPERPSDAKCPVGQARVARPPELWPVESSCGGGLSPTPQRR